jgi:hypothetical protein
LELISLFSCINFSYCCFKSENSCEEDADVDDCWAASSDGGGNGGSGGGSLSDDDSLISLSILLFLSALLFRLSRLVDLAPGCFCKFDVDDDDEDEGEDEEPKGEFRESNSRLFS